MEAAGIQSLFAETGGRFCVPAVDIQRKLKSIKAFVFDWDGVFNDGSKRDLTGSGFSEPDAMGTNMLRFSYWLQSHSLPFTAIITGEENLSADFLGKREHFTAIYFKASDKIKSFDHFLKTHQLKGEEVAFVFDDVLDLAVASQCGIRIACHRRANPVFNQHLEQQNLTDYFTSSHSYHVREASELLIGLRGNYDETIQHRMNFSATYQSYLEERQQVATEVFVGIS